MNFKYIKNCRNVGVSGNQIKAMELANKEYVWIIGDDDKYDFSNWDEIEDAINKDYDMINVYKSYDETNEDKKEIKIYKAYMTSFFLSATIYKTKYINYDSIRFAYYLSQTLNPFNILGAHIINSNGKIFVPSKNIIVQNCDKNYTEYHKKNEFIPDWHSYYNFIYETFILFSLIKDQQIRHLLYEHLLNDNNIKYLFDTRIDCCRLFTIIYHSFNTQRIKILRYYVH